MCQNQHRNDQSYTLSAENRLAKTPNLISRGKIKTNYTVKSGDSFWSIAKSNQVSIDALSRWKWYGAERFIENRPKARYLAKEEKVVVSSELFTTTFARVIR